MATHVPNPAAPLKLNEWLTKWRMMNQWSSFGPLRLCCLFSAVIACHPKSLQIELNLFSLIWSKFQFAVFTYIIQVSRNTSPDFIKVFYYFLFFILFCHILLVSEGRTGEKRMLTSQSEWKIPYIPISWM